MSKTRIQLDEKVPLTLTVTERKMVLDDLMFMDQENEQAIRETPSGKPVMMTLGELDDFIGYIQPKRTTPRISGSKESSTVSTTRFKACSTNSRRSMTTLFRSRKVENAWASR